MTAHTRDDTGARGVASVWGGGQVLLAVIYFLGDELVRRPLQPGQISAVVWLESIGPVWALLFLLSGLWLLGAAACDVGYRRAHIASATLWAFYSGCILISAFLTEPPVPIVTGCLAGIVCLAQIATARANAKRGVR